MNFRYLLVTLKICLLFFNRWSP